MLKINLKINEINYKSVGNKILEISEKSENNSFLNRILTKLGALAVKKLPSSILETLLIKIINAENQPICSALTKLAKENGFDISVSNLIVTKNFRDIICPHFVLK